MDLKFVTLDVFTDTPYKGNPLAVVTIPPSVTLTQAQKQAVAREFNLSETVFVHDEADPSPDRRIDIFTTFQEIPFAGHPTIGTAVALHPSGVTRLLARAGPIVLSPGPAPGHLAAEIPHDIRLHARRVRDLAPPPACLSSDPALAAAEAAGPVFSVVNGMTFILAELPSLELLARVRTGVRPDFRPAELLDPGWGESFVGRYHYVLTGGRAGGGGGGEGGARAVRTVRTRMAELEMEDPATGSAACALCCYLALQSGAGGPPAETHAFEVTQGVEMGRESNIRVEVRLSRDGDGKVSIERLLLGGTAVQIMSGTIKV